MKDSVKEGAMYAIIFASGQVALDYCYVRETEILGVLISTVVATAVFVWLMPKARRFWGIKP